MAPSYVCGSSWQINLLSTAERRRLDREPWVFCCNWFPVYWRRAMFRPSAWCFGDTHYPQMISIGERIVAAWSQDAELLERMRHRFLCLKVRIEAEAEARLGQTPATRYSRGNPRDFSQRVARNLDERIAMFGSTLSDAVNLAAICNPGEEVRVLGCQYSMRFQHFYDAKPRRFDPPEGPANATFMAGFLWRIWRGFDEFRRQGVDVIDCCPFHDEAPPFDIPRKGLFDP